MGSLRRTLQRNPGEAAGLYSNQPQTYSAVALRPDLGVDLITRAMQNNSGADVPKGSVVVFNTGGDDYFTTTTTQDDPTVVGITLADIPAAARGLVAVAGTPKRVRTAAGTLVGQFLRSSATAGVANGTNLRTDGSFALAQTARDAGLGTQEVLLFPLPKGGVYGWGQSRWGQSLWGY